MSQCPGQLSVAIAQVCSSAAIDVASYYFEMVSKAVFFFSFLTLANILQEP